MTIAFYQSELTTLAFLWRLERRDGITIGLTSHDSELTRAGLVYKASPGMVPSSIERDESFSPANVSLQGAITSNAITAEDLRAGRWDGAHLTLSLCDWADETQAPLFLLRGDIGTVDISDTSYSAELRGRTALLEAPVVELTSPACRAELGDKRCRVALSGLMTLARVTHVNGALISVDIAPSDGLYSFGRLRWLDGANAGLTSRIALSQAGVLTLQEPPVFAPSLGTRVELMQGCDKLLTTCVARFNNAVNFRGEPFLPGNDLLARYGV
jgi:uncharacterized phage protein (TIGR02218 family)